MTTPRIRLTCPALLEPKSPDKHPYLLVLFDRALIVAVVDADENGNVKRPKTPMGVELTSPVQSHVKEQLWDYYTVKAEGLMGAKLT